MSAVNGFIDRVEQLRLSDSLSGIDFIQVATNQVELRIFLQHSTLPAPLLALLNALPAAAFSITALDASTPAKVIVTQHVTPIALFHGRHVLHLKLAVPGGFGQYQLHINSSAIDPFYNDLAFSFKANCDSALDCASQQECCPPDQYQDAGSEDYPVDYRGRDFWSLRQTLLDFAAQRYPDWQDRLEADIGMVLAELLAALGDEMSYAQDRIVREFALETASQRRSLRHLARLVDYQLDDGCAASTWLDVEALLVDKLKGGVAVCDLNQQVFFEIGHGLRDLGKDFAIDPDRNQLLPYLWDENNVCLPAGSTDMTLQGHHAASLSAIDANIDPVGRWAMLATQVTEHDPAQPVRQHLIRIVSAHDDSDPLLAAPITRIRWDAPTPVALDLLSLVLRGNLLPATSGKTQLSASGQPLRLRIGAQLDPNDDAQEALERVGSNSSLAYPGPGINADGGSIKYLFSLPGSDQSDLTWLPAPGGQGYQPEILLQREGGGDWHYLPSMVGEDSAKPTSTVFTLEDGLYRRVIGFERFGKLTQLIDYASNRGKTLRFGDGEFGLAPAQGSHFKLIYRLGNGRLMNVAAHTLTRFATSMPASVKSITNPLAASGGRDAESLNSIRSNAPQAWQSVTHRAVKPIDFAEIAQRLPWVQRAGASTRWTGSWPTVFVTPDPLHANQLSAAQTQELAQLMERVRQAGRAVAVMPPVYANLDLIILLCLEPHVYKAALQQQVMEAMFGGRCSGSSSSGHGTQRGFFDPDNFTFGSPLSRAALMAALQAVPGVKAVEWMGIRRRGWFDWRLFAEFSFKVAMNEVVRVSNDPAQPQAGTLKLVMEGGL